jgi:hypothetical protein
LTRDLRGATIADNRDGVSTNPTTEDMMSDIDVLAQLLHETAEHHDPYEKASRPHNWWDWYAAYMNARQNGSTSEQASAAAGQYMREVKGILPL